MKSLHWKISKRTWFLGFFCLFIIPIVSFCLLLRFDDPGDYSVQNVFGFTFIIIVFLGFEITKYKIVYSTVPSITINKDIEISEMMLTQSLF